MCEGYASLFTELCRKAGLTVEEIPGFAKGYGYRPGESPAEGLEGCLGNVVTVEPGVYLPEHGGVRIEDTVLVTSDGCQPLTHAPKLNVI